MVSQFCAQPLKEYKILVRLFETFMLILCVFIVAFSAVATFGNLLAISALCKSSSIPTNLKKLFLSLAFSDLAVGMYAQLMLGAIVTVMLKIGASGKYKFDFYCPSILSTAYFSFFLLACTSFLNVTAIAVDRLLSILLHLRYQERVTPKRVIIAVVSLWLASGVHCVHIHITSYQ